MIVLGELIDFVNSSVLKSSHRASKFIAEKFLMRAKLCLPGEPMTIKPDSLTITGQIYRTIFKLLEENPEGLHWSELLKKIKTKHPSFHPKTINGCVWKLIEKYPDKVYKPSKGLFRLVKDKRKL